MSEFERWLRSVCFQAPTVEAKDLAKCAWDRQQSRIAELEAGLRDTLTDCEFSMEPKLHADLKALLGEGE